MDYHVISRWDNMSCFFRCMWMNLLLISYRRGKKRSWRRLSRLLSAWRNGSSTSARKKLFRSSQRNRKRKTRNAVEQQSQNVTPPSLIRSSSCHRKTPNRTVWYGCLFLIRPKKAIGSIVNCVVSSARSWVMDEEGWDEWEIWSIVVSVLPFFECFLEGEAIQSFPFFPLDSIRAMMILWRSGGQIIRTVLCCVVYDSCVQWHTHTCEQFLNYVGLGFDLVFV